MWVFSLKRARASYEVIVETYEKVRTMWFDFAGSKTRVEDVFVSLYLPKDCFSGHGFPCHYIVDWWVPGW